MTILNKLFIILYVSLSSSFAFLSDGFNTNLDNPNQPPDISVNFVYSICSALDSSDEVYYGDIISFDQKEMELKPNHKNIKASQVFSKKTIAMFLEEAQDNFLYERSITIETDKVFDKKKQRWLSSNKILNFKDTVECGSLLSDYNYIRTHRRCRDFSFSKIEINKSLKRVFFLANNKIFAFSKQIFELIDSNVFDCSYIKDLSKKRIYSFYNLEGKSQDFDKRVKENIYFNPIQLSDYNFVQPVNIGCLVTTDAILLGTIHGEGRKIDSIKKNNECIWDANLFSDSLTLFFNKNKKYTEYKIEYEIDVKYFLERPFKNLNWKKISKTEQRKRMIGTATFGDASCNFMTFLFHSDIKKLNDGNERLFYVNKNEDNYYLNYYSESIIANEVIKDKDPGGCFIQENISSQSIIPYANNIDASYYFLK